MEKLNDNRQKLIKICNGTPQYYCINYCVDVKGNITILRGCELPETAAYDLFMYFSTEEHIWLFDEWKRGRDFIEREKAAEAQLTRDDIVNAYLEFRAQHPNDGYDMLDEDEVNVKRYERDDIEAVTLELKRRNRQYLKELYGVELPIDYDFEAAYNEALQARQP